MKQTLQSPRNTVSNLFSDAMHVVNQATSPQTVCTDAGIARSSHMLDLGSSDTKTPVQKEDRVLVLPDKELPWQAIQELDLATGLSQ